MVLALPPDSIKSVVTVLACGGTLSALDLKNQVLNAVALQQERYILTSLLQAREREENPVPAPYLAAALEGALFTRTSMERASQSELVWTGPSSGMTFRRTDQALLEVINTAKKELFLVTFAAYRVPLLGDAIRKAIDRGVQVSFLGESADESGGKVSFDAANALIAVSDQIHFYLWPLEARETDASGHYGSLHAKVALADTDLLLVSSANLTEHALLLNMEMGLLVRGGLIPRQVRDHFQHLLIRGQIKEV
ncbi:MAG: DISARM system phospholipase D-like protein DrmC [Armatimonas sp.]